MSGVRADMHQSPTDIGFPRHHPGWAMVPKGQSRAKRKHQSIATDPAVAVEAVGVAPDHHFGVHILAVLVADRAVLDLRLVAKAGSLDEKEFKVRLANFATYGGLYATVRDQRLAVGLWC